VTLRINKVDNEDAGVWVIKVTNRFGETRSGTSIQMTNTRTDTFISQQQRTSESQPSSPPTFLLQPHETIYEDENSTLFIELRVVPSNATLQFFRNGQVIQDSSHIKTVTERGYGILEINVAGKEDSGSYTCRASTPLGHTDTIFHVNVREMESSYRSTLPTIQIAPTDATVIEGTTARFYCTITGLPKPRVAWRVNGQQVTNVR
jgi:Immunoglobulin domain/Immunoglobulin I-set domain